jgi:hypothetical protein
LFRSEARPYAIRIASVAEVVRVERLVRLPLAPPRLVGLRILRRDVIPVFRPREAELKNAVATDGVSLVLLIRAAQGIWGLLIDREGLQVREEIPTNHERSSPDPAPDRVLIDEVTYQRIDPEIAWEELQMSMNSWYSFHSPSQLVPIPR